MDISGICNVYYPNRLERVLKAYDNSDLQTFLDENAVWRGAPVTAAEIQAKDAEYEAAKTASQAKAEAEALDEQNTRGDALIQQFIDMSPSQITNAINSRSTIEDLKPILVRIALVTWLNMRAKK